MRIKPKREGDREAIVTGRWREGGKRERDREAIVTGGWREGGGEGETERPLSLVGGGRERRRGGRQRGNCHW